MATWKKVLTVQDIDTDTAFGSASDALVPSQLAVKTYVDAQVDTADALSELADTNIGTLSAGHIIIYDGSDSFDNKAITGDVALASTGAVTINSDAVTYDKMQDISTANRVLGATSAGTVAEVQVQTAMIADDAVTSAKLDTNIDIAGTLDVTSTATFDSDVAILGKLTMTGDIDTVNVTDLDVADKTVTLASSSSTYSDQNAMLAATNGAGIKLQNQYSSGNVSTEAANMSASLTWDNANDLSGWAVKDFTNVPSVAVAVMDFQNQSGQDLSGVNASGIGSFSFNSADNELYIRIS
jgi:hypothetical protein